MQPLLKVHPIMTYNVNEKSAFSFPSRIFLYVIQYTIHNYTYPLKGVCSMRIVIPDDYQDAVRSLDCFHLLAQHHVTIYNDDCKDTQLLAHRFQEADALVLIRERTAITEELLAQLPDLKLIAQTG